MDKKSIIGLILIFGIFVGYMFWVAPSKEEMAERQRVYDSMVLANVEAQRLEDSILAEKARLDSLAAAGDTVLPGVTRKVQDMGVFNAAAQGDGQSLTVSNDRMTVEFNTLGARVDRVVLADYQTYDSNELVLITPSEENMNLVFSTEDNRVVSTKDLVFKTYVDGKQLTADGSALEVGENDSLVVSFRAEIEGDSSLQTAAPYLEFRYTVRGGSHEVGFDINFVGLGKVVRNTPYMDFQWQNRMLRQEKVNSGSRGKSNRNSDRERYYTSIYYKTPKDKNPDNLSLGQDKQKQVKTNLEWVAFKDQYFAAIMH